MFAAWREFKRGKTKKKDLQEFEFSIEDRIFELHDALREKQYRPDLYSSFYVCDPKLRLIHKATVRDRVVHQAMVRVLYPIFDRYFIYDSYSCRLKKGTIMGVKQFARFARKVSINNTKNIYVLKCDVKKFFHSIDQNILHTIFAREGFDMDTLWLIEKIIGSFNSGAGVGLPLGNVTSQLFANVYLNEFDHFVKHELKEKYYIRYCDDFVILDSNREHLKQMLPMISDFLKTALKLYLHPSKVSIRKFRQGVDFLGYVQLPYYRVLRTVTKKRMFKQLNAKNKDSYLGILKHCSGHAVVEEVKEKTRTM